MERLSCKAFSKKFYQLILIIMNKSNPEVFDNETSEYTGEKCRVRKFFLRGSKGISLSAILLIFIFFMINIYISIPKSVVIKQGDSYKCIFYQFLNEKNVTSDDLAFDVSKIKKSLSISGLKPVVFFGDKVGVYDLSLSIGPFQVKKVQIKVIPDLKIIPCGNAVGIKIDMKGVMVAALSEVEIGNKKFHPSRSAGFQLGDIILKIDGEDVDTSQKFSQKIQSCGGNPMDVLVERNGKSINIKLSPVYDYTDMEYKVGMWVRDSASGIGTLSFCYPDEKMFGALGHGVTDTDTGNMVNIGSGELVISSITDIKPGEKGMPGELIGQFTKDSIKVGNILVNNKFGIYGKVVNEFFESLDKEPMPIATKMQVKEGTAYIFSCIDGENVEQFEINIERVSRNAKDSNKGMVIKIVDEDLLSRTGGIVQGMSGSPIIQEGKVVGAVTHVFVNDPQKGYATFIDTMLDNAGILSPDDNKEEHDAPAA